jgi:hypothetical protein
MGMLLMCLAMLARAEMAVLDAEVLEASRAVEVPGTAASRIRFLVLHHKHSKDRSRLSDWLRRHDGAPVEFRTHDGETYTAVLHRLKHCSGRGLLFYSEPVDFKQTDVIEIRLEIRQ